MLFSDIDRTFKGSKLYAEPDYDYLDRSARPEAGSIRAVLEKWFAQYPCSDRGDLLGRFTSPSDTQHNSAGFELYLYELFRLLGYSVQVHPETSSGKTTRPDFLLRDANGSRMYVEAVQTTDVSTEEQGAQARLNVVYDAINRLEVFGWFLGVKARNYPVNPPSGRNLRRQLKDWLEGLDPEQVTESVKKTGHHALPMFDYADGEWRIQFTAFPRSPEKRDKPVRAVLGVLFGGAQWLNTWEVLRDTLIFKGSRYGDLDAPLVIAVNADVLHLDEIDIMEALFGKERYLINLDEQDHEPEMQRASNGFWNGPKGPRYTRVAGVLIGFDVNPWTYGVRNLTLYQNPWAKMEVSGPISTLPRKVPLDGQMDSVAGCHAKDILQLPQGYPGL
jgi:hypothetical protein